MELRSISKNIIGKHMIRRTRKQKDKFISYVQDELLANNISSTVDESRCRFRKNKNIIIGDIEHADTIFTAHYDTSRISLPFLPNLDFTNKFYRLLFYAYMFLVVIIISIPFLFFIPFRYSILCSLLLLLFLMKIMPINKNNYNDNTSGVLVLLETLLNLENEEMKKCAFVMFDNEEYGLLGSKKFKTKYKKIIATKSIINFDCIGAGKHIAFTYRKENKDIVKIKYICNFDDNVIFKPGLKIRSDNRNFKNSIGVMSYKKNKFIGFYLNNIHTKKDVELNLNNIFYLKKLNQKFIRI